MSLNPPAEAQWTQSYKQDSGRVGFLDLPRELRDLIYEFAFRVQGAIFIYTADPSKVRPIIKAKVIKYKNSGPSEPRPVHRVIPIALTRTCRQIRAESCGVLYGDNTFRLYMSDVPFTPYYQSLVRKLIFTTDTDHRIYVSDLETVGYWWRKRFWPDVIFKSTKLLERFPCLESLTFPIQSNRHGQTWRPAFLGGDHKTREQRVALASSWLAAKCPFGSERMRNCLHLEITPASRILPREAYEGSYFAPDDDEWDYTEFAEAFERMKTLAVALAPPANDQIKSSVGFGLSQLATTIMAIQEAGKS